MAANTQILANDTTHKQDNSFVCNHCHRKSKMISFLLTHVDSIYPGGSRAMDLMHAGPLYHVPELATWGLSPLLLVRVPITVYVLNKAALPRPRKEVWEEVLRISVLCGQLLAPLWSRRQRTSCAHVLCSCTVSPVCWGKQLGILAK